jgi:hypothetical protein
VENIVFIVVVIANIISCSAPGKLCCCPERDLQSSLLACVRNKESFGRENYDCDWKLAKWIEIPIACRLVVVLL